MASTVALHLTKWTLDLLTRLVKANVRVHNADVVEPDMAIIFTANHFTRLETLLLPYIIHQYTKLEPWSLAAAKLFQGRIGQYLKSVGAVSTEDPDRDSIIIRSLLRGDHPWIIFPEGAMIKDKRVYGTGPTLEIYDGFRRRPPHTGAAALALRTAYYRAKLRCLCSREKKEDLEKALQLFQLQSVDEVVSKRTVIIPVSITYYPIRARENIFLRSARLMTSDLSDRALAELSVEGTVLAENTDIDITFGQPINVLKFLEAPEYGAIMACGLNDLEALEENPREVFQKAARMITQRFMTEIYAGITVNFDHIFAEIVRYQPEGSSTTERSYRERIYLGGQSVLKRAKCVHPDLTRQLQSLLSDETHSAFNEFLTLLIEKKFLIPDAQGYRRAPQKIRPLSNFHTMPRDATPHIIANEFEASQTFSSLLRYVAWAPEFAIKAILRRRLYREDLEKFEKEYARNYHPQLCKPPWVGRPFLLVPWRVRGGVVLAHGYMAAPLEVRALAEHLYRKGFAVYGVRLKGHGTAPEALAECDWESWYDSLNSGYAILRTLTQKIFVGGFSTGGCLALLAAARKRNALQGVFSICAPLYVRSYSIRLVPSIISLNTLLKRFGQGQYAWDYVENNPENKHINYTRNPLTGVQQLTEVMNATLHALPDIDLPVFVIQASKDPTVDPSSGPAIFEQLGTKQKELVLVERDRHGIINGEGSGEVFTHVENFLLHRVRAADSERYWLLGRRVGQAIGRLTHRHSVQ